MSYAVHLRLIGKHVVNFLLVTNVLKTAVYTNVNSDIVSYTLKTARKGDITQQHIAKCQCVVK